MENNLPVGPIRQPSPTRSEPGRTDATAAATQVELRTPAGNLHTVSPSESEAASNFALETILQGHVQVVPTEAANTEPMAAAALLPLESDELGEWTRVPEGFRHTGVSSVAAEAMTTAGEGPAQARQALALLACAPGEPLDPAAWVQQRHAASRALHVVLKLLKSYGMNAQDKQDCLRACERLVSIWRQADMQAAALLEGHPASSPAIIADERSQPALQDFLQVLDCIEGDEASTLACLEQIRQSFGVCAVQQAIHAVARLAPETSRELLSWIGQHFASAMQEASAPQHASEQAALWACLALRDHAQHAEGGNEALTACISSLQFIVSSGGPAAQHVAPVLAQLELLGEIWRLQLDQPRDRPSAELAKIARLLDAHAHPNEACSLLFQHVLGAWVEAAAVRPFMSRGGAMMELFWLCRILCHDKPRRLQPAQRRPLQFPFVSWQTALKPLLERELGRFYVNTTPQMLYTVALERQPRWVVTLMADAVAQFILESPDAARHIQTILQAKPNLLSDQHSLWHAFHIRVLLQLVPGCVGLGLRDTARLILQCLRRAGPTEPELLLGAFTGASMALSELGMHDDDEVVQMFEELQELKAFHLPSGRPQ